jgi:NAD(P)-dependent dehydrogenase (short-subunit alcohol dehydrogenase family)
VTFLEVYPLCRARRKGVRSGPEAAIVSIMSGSNDEQGTGTERDASSDENPVTKYRSEGFPRQEQDQPGLTSRTDPPPDHGEESYVGTKKLHGKRALITGGDSGIGRAVAIAFAREGADVAISYLPEEQSDAESTAGWIRDAGRAVLLLPGDAQDEDYCESLVTSTVSEFGGLDILVLNAAYQENRDGLENIPTAEFDRVFRTNLYATMWIARTAIPLLKPGASIITTSSIQAFQPSPGLIDYAMTKAALVAFTKALAQQLGGRGVRVNAVAPGPVWTPLIPATSWPDRLPSFGQDTPLGRAAQPAELAPAYVYLASSEASYVSGAVIPVTGGKGL